MDIFKQLELLAYGQCDANESTLNIVNQIKSNTCDDIRKKLEIELSINQGQYACETIVTNF